MESQEPNSQSEDLYRQKLVLWFALISSVVMYFVITRVIPAAVVEVDSSLTMVLLVAAVGLVAVSFLLKSRLSAKPGIVSLAIPLALCEAAALFGVVVHFVTGSPSAPYFILLGVFGMVMHFPRRAG